MIQGVTIVRGKTLDHQTSNYFRAVATSTVGLVSTGPLFGAPKLFLTHSMWHHWQTGWQLRVQLSSFKIDVKMAANWVKASLPVLPGKPHHPNHFAFPKRILGKPSPLTACIVLSHKGGYRQRKATSSPVLKALNKAF